MPHPAPESVQQSRTPLAPLDRARAEAWELLEKTVEAFGLLTEDWDAYNALADLLISRPHGTQEEGSE